MTGAGIALFLINMAEHAPIGAPIKKTLLFTDRYI
jgi:hypothetical protein